MAAIPRTPDFGPGLGRDGFAPTFTSTSTPSNNPFDPSPLSSRAPSVNFNTAAPPYNRRSFDGRLSSSSSTNPFADFAMDPNAVPRSSSSSSRHHHRPLSHNPYHHHSKTRDSLHPSSASSSAYRRRRGTSVTDTIDALGAFTPFGLFHVDGPYEATLRSRNLYPKYSPVEAVRASNMEALRATPQACIQDSLDMHVPLQGTATVPPGERDVGGNVMDYEEGTDMMRENRPGGGAYKQWDHVEYDPNDLKGKGEPSYSIEKAEKEEKMRLKREKQLRKEQQKNLQQQHRPAPHRVSSSSSSSSSSSAGHEMGLLSGGGKEEKGGTEVYERVVSPRHHRRYRDNHDDDKEEYGSGEGGAYALHRRERSGSGSGSGSGGRTRERISEGIRRTFGGLRRRRDGSGEY